MQKIRQIDLSVSVILCFAIVGLTHGAPPKRDGKTVATIPEFVEAEVKAGTPETLADGIRDVQRRRRKLRDGLVIDIVRSQKFLKVAQRGKVFPGQQGTVVNVNGAITFPSKQAKADYIADNKMKLQEFEAEAAAAATDRFMVPEFDRPISVGDVGRVTGGVRVVQVVNAQELRIDARIGGENRDLWLTDFDAKSVTDGQALIVKPALLIVGTKSYTTVTGAKRTVFVAKPFDIHKYLVDEPTPPETKP